MFLHSTPFIRYGYRQIIQEVLGTKVVVLKVKRRYKTKGKRYLNGWNVNSEIVNLFNVRDNDLLVIESENSAGQNFVKIATFKQQMQLG